MAGTWETTYEGLGTGRFWHFLTHEMLPCIERDYPQTWGGQRLMAGFSLGGYTVSLLAAQSPGYFDHAGIYDGTFMWPRHIDPRQKQTGTWSDRVWCQAPIFDAALGLPRVTEAMRRWNSTDAISMAEGTVLDQLRRTTFHVGCAASDGNKGNRDRATYFVKMLRKKAIPLASENVIFALDAAHTWHWADLFLIRFLSDALDAV
jgi:S-formylglutathione hydrolase FrmB